MDKRLSQPKRMKNVNKELLSVRGGTMFDLGNRTFTSFTKWFMIIINTYGWITI